MSKLLFSILFILLGRAATAQPIAVNHWYYLQIDDQKAKWGDWNEPSWLRYFGLDMGDIDGDGDLDIVSGRYVYHNPGGDMSGDWARTELPQNVDGILFLDVDGDDRADLIAQALPEVYWFEAVDKEGKNWTGKKIGEVPATSHVNSQGFERGQFLAGGKEEFVIAGDGDLYLFEVPADPSKHDWKITLIGADTSDEGIGIGDVDGDGDLDLAAGRRPEGVGEPLIVVWFENPGDGSGNWKDTEVGRSNHPVDRVEVADLNGDGRTDIVVAEERYPGQEPDGSLFWFEQPAGEEVRDWPRHRVVTQYSMNNLDVADVDADGDMDLVTNEHKRPALETQLWKNDGAGQFTKQVIDRGKENPLGT